MPTRFLKALVAALALVLLAAAGASAMTLKQNKTDDAEISISCSPGGGAGTRTAYLRRFDLVDDYGVTDPFRVSSVSFGVGIADAPSGSQTVWVRVFTTPADRSEMRYDILGHYQLGLLDEVAVTVDDSDSGDILTIPVDARLNYPEDHDLVIAVFDQYEEDTRFVLTANQDGETGSSYVMMNCDGAYWPMPTSHVTPEMPVSHVLWADGDPASSPDQLDVTGAPSIQGSLRGKEPMSVEHAGWSPNPTHYTYQWLNGDFPIDGATGPTFTPPADWAGTPISVVETAHRPGYAPRERVSAEVTVLPAAFTNTAAPTISGTPRVGETLTVTGGTWSPTPEGRSYQWYVDGVPVDGATGTSFVPRPGDVGLDVHVVERVTATDYAPGEASSADVGPVLPGVITNTVLPVITGGTRVLDRLTVSPGTWVPPDADLAYRWLADGEEIAGATGGSYDLRPADLGRSVSVEVTASKDGYLPTTVETAAVGPVQRCVFALGRAPTVLGELAVGETLEAVAGDWRPVPGTVGYQWFVDGAPIPGATAVSYTLRPDDLGRRITVRVDVGAEACIADTATSAPSEPVAEGTMRPVARPLMDGHPALGVPVTVSAGEWDVEPTAVTYQWMRAGQPIPGATGATYTPVPEDVKKWLSVAVTVSAPGYASREINTAAAFPVSPVVGENLVRPTISGTPTTGSTLTVDPGEWSFDPEQVEVRWYAGPRRIGGASGEQLVLDDPDLVGEAISVQVTVSSEVQPPVSATSERTAPVRKARPGLEVDLSTRTPQVRETRVAVDIAVTGPATLPVEGDLRVLVDGRRVATEAAGDGSVRVTLPVFRTTGRHRVVVRYGGSDLLAPQSTKTILRVRRRI